LISAQGKQPSPREREMTRRHDSAQTPRYWRRGGASRACEIVGAAICQERCYVAETSCATFTESGGTIEQSFVLSAGRDRLWSCTRTVVATSNHLLEWVLFAMGHVLSNSVTQRRLAMRRTSMRFGLLFAVLLVFGLAVSGGAFAQPGFVTDLGVTKAPNGALVHSYQVHPPEGYCAGLLQPQPDGSIKTQYFRTVDDYNAAVASMASGAGPTTTVWPSALASIDSADSASGPSAVTTSGNRTITFLGTIYDGLGYTMCQAKEKLGWHYNGSTATWTTFSYYGYSSYLWGWWGPWDDHGVYNAGSYCESWYLAYFRNGSYVNECGAKLDGWYDGAYGVIPLVAIDTHFPGYYYGWVIQ